MEPKDFFDRFKRALEKVKRDFSLDNLHDALIVWFGENYLFLDPEDVSERIVKDKYAEGIDAVLIDERNFNLIFLQAKTVEEFNKTQSNLPENDIKSTLMGIRFVLKGDYKRKITPELENLIDEYHELDRTGDYKTKVIFLTMKQGPVDDKFIREFRKEFPETEVEIIDFNKLMDFYENVYLVRLSSPPKKLSFEIITNILKKDSPYKSRIFTIRAKEIARAYDEHKETIFQQNVRYFLGMRSRSINKQIYESAISDEDCNNFWYFNNGITMVCKKIKETTSGKVINLECPQIINGAQTTYALHNAYANGKLKESTEILLRVIETADVNFIEKITLYTNSQNAIRLRDLCSNDPVQIKIQKILLDSYGYFYERKRGEFESLYPLPKRKRILGDEYRAKIISNENAAQAFLAFYLNKPAQAKSEKKRIFIKDEYGFYKEIFDEKDSILPEKLLLAWKLLKFIEYNKKIYKEKYKLVEEKDENEREKIYKYDFILHAEYFMLNLFRDFLREKGYDLQSKKDDVIKIIGLLDLKHEIIKNIYSDIKESMLKYINQIKYQPGYYHNKFFKNEKSIGLVRDFFRKKYDFIEVLT